jgi:Fe-S-cluster containining protein
MTKESTLFRLHADIDARVEAIRTAQPDWLCGKGCAGCCRRLAAVPQLTAQEWALLREGLLALPAARLDDIRQKVAARAVHSPRPVICPMLDEQTSACPVYAHRPVACRTYGFYVQRELGLYCDDIASQVAEGALPDVIWGNHNAVDHTLTTLSETRTLTDWFDL